MNKLLLPLVFILSAITGGLYYHNSQQQDNHLQTMQTENPKLKLKMEQLTSTASQQGLKEALDRVQNDYNTTYHTDIDLKNSGQKSRSAPLSLGKLKKQYKDYCLKDRETGELAKDVKKMNEAEKLEAFVKGPCSPAILIPGILGTSLQVQIDCEVMQQEEPEAFKACGWNSCTHNVPLIYSKPDAEYRLWVGGVTEPTSIFSFGSDQQLKGQCFGELVQLRRHKGETDPLKQYTSPKGVKVNIYGFTPGSSNHKECGDGAIKNIMETSLLENSDCGFKDFNDMMELMKVMGYQPGITYQSLPYDFRHSVKQLQTDKILKTSLEGLKKYTGKKAHVLTHSYGSLHALYGFSKMSQEFKDQHVNTFIPTGGPFQGAPELVQSSINSDSSFITRVFGFLGKDFIGGITFAAQRLNAKGSCANFDLYPKNVQELHQNEDWMKELLERVKYEQTNLYTSSTYEGSSTPLDIFPSTNDVCKPMVKGVNKYCQTYLYDQLREPVLQVEDSNYYLKYDQIKQFLEKYSTFSDIVDMFEDNWQPVFTNLTNPGVKVTNVYGAFGNTAVRFRYEDDPNEYTKQNEYYFPDNIQFSGGDTRVNTNSALTGPIKWYLEHKKSQGKDSSKKPVQFVELCSDHKQVKDINNDFNEQGQKIYTQSAYHGLNCKSLYTLDPEDSQHACIISDPYYLEFIANTLLDQQPSSYVLEGKIPKFDNDEITYDMAQCPNLGLYDQKEFHIPDALLQEEIKEQQQLE